MEDFEELFNQTENKSKATGFNPKEVVFKYIRLWPLFIISTSLLLLTVFIYHRYTTERFNIEATILIPEQNRDIDQSILKEFSFDFGAVFLNEIEILKSKPLTRDALKDLDFDVSYFSKGRIKTIQEYRSLPFRVEYDDNHEQPFNEELRLIFYEGNRFSIGRDDQVEAEEPILFSPGDWVESSQYRFRVVFDVNANVLGKTYYFKIHTLESLVDSFYGRLEVTYLKAFSSIAVLRLNTEVPNRGVDFINKLLEIYQRRELTLKNSKAEKTIEFIDAQMDTLEESLTQLSNRRAEYRIDNRFLDLSSKGTELLTKINESDLEIRKLERQVLFLKQSLIKIEKNDSLQDLVSPSLYGIDDSYINQYTEDISELTLEKAGLLQFLEPYNNLIQSIDEQIIQVKKNLNNYVSLKVEELEAQLEDYYQENEIVEKDFQMYPNTERGYLEIERRFNIVNGIYTNLLQRRQEASIVAASNVANSEVVEPAVLPSQPFFPNYQLNYLVGGALGLILPLLFIVIRELTFNRIETRGQIERITSIPIIGVIGHNEQKSNLAIFDKPKSIIAETFRSLRSNLQYFSAEKELQTILVTSGSSGEGKSFCSVNLASIMAISGKKTILIGLDLRKPKLFDDFGMTNDIGVSNYLGGFVEMERYYIEYRVQ